MKKSKGLSRGTSIDTEVCVINAGGSRFDMVLIASTRARELERQNRNNGDQTLYVNPSVTALLELQSGKIGKEYLKRVK
jgi:DNA-directed RNA polymerase subunit K/omega